MSATEILAELSKLTEDELYSLARQVDITLRERGAIVYSDAYGIFTEADQTALATEAWDLMDGDHGTASKK